MLVESFVAAIGTASAKPNTSQTKDVGIFLHEHQPTLAPRALYKKSAAAPNCVAVSQSHIFAAQADKAVVHVYNREKGAQEATVPFPEKVTSLCLALDDTVLVLGTEGGRVCLWEIATGRSLTGPQTHLQAITVVAVDPPSQYILSGSADSNIHVWSLPALLSFTAPTNPAPLHTLSNHRAAVTALAVGHSCSAANIVLSASADNTVIAWDYKANQLLATYLLGDTALALALDAADRLFFATYADGSVQAIDFYADDSADAEPRAATDSLRDIDTSYTPLQPAPSTRWHAPSQDLGAALSAALSWDGSTLLTGHASGKVAAWSPASSAHFRNTVATLPGPATNLAFLPPTGWPDAPAPRFKVPAVLKPRQDLKTLVAGGEVASPVPKGYAITAQLCGSAEKGALGKRKGRNGTQRSASAFDDALTCATGFPPGMLEASLAELTSFASSYSFAHAPSGTTTNAPPASTAAAADMTTTSADVMALDSAATSAAPASETEPDLERQNRELKAQVAALQRVQETTFGQLAELREECRRLGGGAGAGGSGVGEGNGVKGGKGGKGGKGDGKEKEKEKKRKERLSRVLGSDED
ncbi:uncharacterized protein K452DRAFT_269245 [Aplosporella prunicola CBS 121167]|uniref:Pre-rRNA-processing protein IPI3 n=1 Tax=Aplosporella prunicola CBS 121167 TaxID=1176127 RepID=A0A6A6BGR5_9PEZI|nr:uncharacterized protein K452DRAFT_269245 [Aplosporella prunicola CBS 121167]KAF2142788.1 hypothetical protein K452DRAFT_269245 [Aplosporella prunicola CBS 121167]